MDKVKQIVHKKLGKEKANGLAFCDTGVINIDERLRGREHLLTCIHEIMHIQNSKWSELKVEGHSEEMTKWLWDMGYRRIIE